jgi:hypothetical protein
VCAIFRKRKYKSPSSNQRILGCPTVADDLALLANSTSDLQLMLDVTNPFANREKYVIHPEKSTIRPFNS